MNIIDIAIAMLAGLGCAFLVFLTVGIVRAASEYKYQRQREKQYADEWVRRHRLGEPGSVPRRQGGE